jgi:hypothetical protein
MVVPLVVVRVALVVVVVVATVVVVVLTTVSNHEQFNLHIKWIVSAGHLWKLKMKKMKYNVVSNFYIAC